MRLQEGSDLPGRDRRRPGLRARSSVARLTWVAGRLTWVTGRLTCIAALLTSVLACSADGGSETGEVDEPGDPFTVRFETSQGPVDVELVPEWSPLAVERVRELAELGYWEGARIYRVNDRYAQFGYSGRPELDSVWIPAGIPDEPTRASNTRGTVSFARGGPGTRSAILFINRTDNTNLDQLAWNGVVGFPPVGRVVSGMGAVDALHAEYGDQPMQWEDSIAEQGNAFLDRAYPALDSITGVEIVGRDSRE